MPRTNVLKYLVSHVVLRRVRAALVAALAIHASACAPTRLTSGGSGASALRQRPSDGVTIALTAKLEAGFDALSVVFEHNGFEIDERRSTRRLLITRPRSLHGDTTMVVRADFVAVDLAGTATIVALSATYSSPSAHAVNARVARMNFLSVGPWSTLTTLGDALRASAFAEQLDALRQSEHIPGLAVVVLRDTNVILARGFGFANIAQQILVSPQTPFNIASVSKPISAVVALRLAERGLLDLDRRMMSFSGFAAFCADARASGGIFFNDYQCDAPTLTLRRVLSMTANGDPGRTFLYNPPSYSWASRPMAEVSHTSFSELVQELVFGPAGMSRSARIHRSLALRESLASDLARPYHLDSLGRFVPSDAPPPQGDGAAGGVISTAMDLAHFDIALTNDQLISAPSKQLMWTASPSPSGSTLPYGLGWFVQRVAGETLLWHSGLWEGAYSALYLKVPSRHLTLILLANSDGLRWESRLNEAAVERSPFAAAFLKAFRPE